MVIFVALKICTDNFVFYITHMKYFDILCYFLLLILMCLYILVRNKKIFNKISENKWQKVVIVFISLVFITFLTFIFLWLLNVDSFNGCSIKYEYPISVKTNNQVFFETKKIRNSKVIVIGDSRMEFIVTDDKIKLPFNFEFIAKSGMGIDWLENSAVLQLENILTNVNYNYHVIVNVGVNDLNQVQYQGKEVSKRYFQIYKSLAQKHPNVKFYLLSINPIVENKLNKSEPRNVRTTKKIKLFNKTTIKELDKSKLKNMHYCDSYNEMKFKTDDGLHYTRETNEDIINYIANKCVKF